MTKIECRICGAETHVMRRHLESDHPEVSLAEYRERFPEAPVLSDAALAKIREAKSKTDTETAVSETTKTKKALHDVFGIPSTTAGVLNGQGKAIPIIVMNTVPEGYEGFVPKRDPNYIFSIDSLKIALLGIETGINTYLVGHAGTGKSSLYEQIFAHTNRATMRVQHTVNTEESHILGQYVVKDGATVWEPGPLQLCMRYGLVYMADEYDRAMPQVLSAYQPVLENKALLTKEAPPEWRMIEPHPDFRICATGNTNGAGDETGLYPSTALQDFANYERFGIMLKIDWMPAKQEVAVVSGQSGIPTEDAEVLVRFANEIRKQVDGGEISAPISPRALINAAKIGMRFKDYGRGVELAYINRLGEADAEVCKQVAQRHLG